MARVHGQLADFRRSENLADPQHHTARIVAPARLPPELELLGKVWRGLSGERRIGGPDTFTAYAMASGAGRQVPRRVAVMIERIAPRRRRCDGRGRQSGIVRGNREPLSRGQPTGDPAHLLVLAPPIGIGFHLPIKVSGVEACQARNPRAVARSVQPVASEAGVRRPGACTAVRDELSVLSEPVGGSRFDRRATSQQRQGGGSAKGVGGNHALSTARRKIRFHYLLVPMLLGACKPPPDNRTSMPAADPAHGLAVIDRVGCGSCHTIPGLYWPQGKVGPDLAGLAARTLIAGELPNRPDLLASFIRDAPALVPRSGMPAMPISEAEARDVAAYLYKQGPS